MLVICSELVYEYNLCIVGFDIRLIQEDYIESTHDFISYGHSYRITDGNGDGGAYCQSLLSLTAMAVRICQSLLSLTAMAVRIVSHYLAWTCNAPLSIYAYNTLI